MNVLCVWCVCVCVHVVWCMKVTELHLLALMSSSLYPLTNRMKECVDVGGIPRNSLDISVRATV